MGKLLGEYLKDMTSLTSNQIVDALRNQLILKDRGDYRRLGELLVDAGRITRQQLEEALQQQGMAHSSDVGRTFADPIRGTPTDLPHLNP